jgi:hypothetical protein
MDNTIKILTFTDIATILRCSKTHPENVSAGKVNSLPTSLVWALDVAR